MKTYGGKSVFEKNKIENLNILVEVLIAPTIYSYISMTMMK